MPASKLSGTGLLRAVGDALRKRRRARASGLLARPRHRSAESGAPERLRQPRSLGNGGERGREAARREGRAGTGEMRQAAVLISEVFDGSAAA